MVDDALFESAWMKCVWAVAQGNQLKREIAVALKEGETKPPFTTRQEYHPEFHGFSVRIATVSPVPARWGLTLGDIVGAYHASLDHLAWALVSRGTRPPSTLTAGQQKGIYFPICSTPGLFKTQITRYLPGVHRQDIARVRKAQPYIQGKKSVVRHCLTTLLDLSNADKHRTIQPVWLRSEEVHFGEVVQARDCIVRRFRDMRSLVLEVDTEIERVYAKKTGPDPDIALKGYLAPHVAFGDGMWVQNFLDTIGEFVPQLLAQFSQVGDDFVRVVLGQNSLDSPGGSQDTSSVRSDQPSR